MNAHVRDEFLMTPHIVVRKTADESVSSSTALQDDNHLFFALAANEIWYVRFCLYVIDASNGTASFKAHFTGPASCVWSLNAIGLDQGGSTIRQHEFNNSADLQTDFLGRSAGQSYDIHGFVVNSSTAGNFTLQWAQQVSNASAVTVKANSFVWGQKLA